MENESGERDLFSLSFTCFGAMRVFCAPGRDAIRRVIRRFVPVAQSGSGGESENEKLGGGGVLRSPPSVLTLPRRRVSANFA